MGNSQGNQPQFFPQHSYNNYKSAMMQGGLSNAQNMGGSQHSLGGNGMNNMQFHQTGMHNL